jgi:rhodanese-related sulfurtransferase
MIDDLTPSEFKEYLNKDGVILIDVREPGELEVCKINGAINTPMSSIEDTFGDLDSSKSYALYCHHGVRSMRVANFLSSKGFQSLVNLQGGIDAWSLEIDSSVERY